MSVELRIQHFGAFLGTQEGVHSIPLPDVFSPSGSRNMFIDKFGRATEMFGYVRLHPTKIDASNSMVVGLFPYRRNDAGTFTRQIIAVIDNTATDWDIYVSNDTGETWGSPIETTNHVGRIPDFAQFGNDVFIVNGQLATRVYDGTTISLAGSVQSPTPTAASNASQGQLSGTYQYKLVSVFGDGSRKAGSAASNAIQRSGNQVDLSWTADADLSVVGYEIYRTTGTGTVAYFTDYVDGRTTVAYTDNISDLTILEQRVIQEHGDPPPTGIHFVEPHRQRLWYARTDMFPRRVWWSDPGDPDSVGLFSYLEFEDAETQTDVITGMMGGFEGQLIVFQERAIWTVSGTGQIIGNIEDWTQIRTNAQIGAVSHRAAARIPAGAKFTDERGREQSTNVTTIAYFTPLGDIRLFDGDNDVIISHPVRDTLAQFSYENRTKIHCFEDQRFNNIVWCYPGPDETEPDRAVVWNYKYGTWYIWTNTPFSSSATIETLDDAQMIIAGESDRIGKGAFVYDFFTGSTWDGAAITSRWMTKDIYGVDDSQNPAVSVTKRFRWTDLVVNIDDGELTAEWLPGRSQDDAPAFGAAASISASSELASSDGNTITSSDGNAVTAYVISVQDQTVMKDMAGRYLHDTSMRLRLTKETGAGWSIEAMNVAYQFLPGLKRRL